MTYIVDGVFNALVYRIVVSWAYRYRLQDVEHVIKHHYESTMQLRHYYGIDKKPHFPMFPRI